MTFLALYCGHLKIVQADSSLDIFLVRMPIRLDRGLMSLSALNTSCGMVVTVIWLRNSRIKEMQQKVRNDSSIR